MTYTFESLKQKWQQLTMALGVWLIGGRDIAVHPEVAFREWRESRFTSNLQSALNDVIKERDDAIKHRDEWRAEFHKLRHAGEKLERSYTLLRARYNTLRDHSIPHPFKFAKTSSKKPKAKRVKK